MADKITDSHDLIAALCRHAKTLGWEIFEYEWKGEGPEGDDQYAIFVMPAGSAE